MARPKCQGQCRPSWATELVNLDGRYTHLDLGVTIVPLVAQHGDKHGEKGRGHARMMDRFNVDGGGFDANPPR